MDKKSKNALVIGSYDESYPRNLVLISAFEEMFNVREINLAGQGRCRYINFFLYLLKHRKDCDYIFLMQPAHRFAFLVMIFKMFFRQPKIIYDAFFSLYDTFIFDRQLASRYSPKALYYYILDCLLCRMADILVFDTYEHQKYFSQTFRMSRAKKKIVLPVAVDYEKLAGFKVNEFRPDVFSKDTFNVLFYGWFTPMQGVEYIIKAARILEKKEKIRLIILSSRKLKSEAAAWYKKLKPGNIKFVQSMPYVELIKGIKIADMTLGIFGATDKAKRVIPNKVIDGLACGKIVVTGRNKEMEKYFLDKQDIIFCNMADAGDLAEKILYVYNNYQNLKHIEHNAQKKVKKYFSRERLVQIIDQGL